MKISLDKRFRDVVFFFSLKPCRKIEEMSSVSENVQEKNSFNSKNSDKSFQRIFG